MRKRKGRGRRWLFTLLTLFLITSASLIGYYAYHFYSAMSKAYQPGEQSEKRKSIVNISADPVSILLLGVDERKYDKGRSDTMIVMTVNPRQKTIKLTHIPRDTYVTIPGKPGKDKINHAYAFGGAELAKETAEGFLDIPIDYYIKVNMQGFRNIIDELDGIEVDVPFDFQFQGYTFHKGPMVLQGDAALRFAQMRKSDPMGDLGRIERQQQVIKGILRKGTSLSTLGKWDDVMVHMGNHMTTDMSPWDLLKLQQFDSRLNKQQIQSIRIKGDNQKLKGVYYYMVSDEERRRVRKALMDHLELSP
ncbi:LytR family transcriptional regulator [Kroppenstedtia pulmonis]|uniref:LytR family transcriptional regulator n=1 Tax=Kroppenstedtia pulmonis TaxID=1380685 RepID=A0A7D3Y3K5_9BACL|nr:LCP family protein [Kroppenstedtia pulmonis]QKG85683.1 LytR family transcriptional regulator [Kroppenstedtia pulmonis]